MSMTKNVVTFVLLILVSAYAIYQSICTRCDNPVDFVLTAKHPKPFLVDAMDMPTDSFVQRLHACLAALGWLLKTFLESALEIFRWIVLVIYTSAFCGLICWGLDALWWWYHGGVKSNIPFYRVPATTTSTDVSSPVFMPLPATIKSLKQPTPADEITPRTRICIVLAMPLFVVLGFLIVGVVGATAFLSAVQYGYFLLRNSLSTISVGIGRRLKRSFTSLTFLYAVTIAMIFGSYSSITITSTKHRLTLKIKPTTTNTKKRGRITKSTRLRRRTPKHRPLSVFSSITIDAATRTDTKGILRPINSTTTATPATTSITTDSNTAPLIHIPVIDKTVDDRYSASLMLNCRSSSSSSSSSSSCSSSSSSSSSSNSTTTTTLVPTTTTAEAERIRSETISRAARDSFMDQIDVMEGEESKWDDYISAVLPVRRSFIDSTVAPQRKVNKLVNICNYIKTAFNGKIKSQVFLSVDTISKFEVRACKEASHKSIFFNKVFERKLSSSTSSTLSSSSPTKHRQSSVSSFGEDPLAHFGGAA